MYEQDRCANGHWANSILGQQCQGRKKTLDDRTAIQEFVGLQPHLLFAEQ